MRPSERRDVHQELRGNASSVAVALRDSMAEVKRVPVNDDGGKEVQVGYAKILALQCHLALSRNRPEFNDFKRSNGTGLLPELLTCYVVADTQVLK